jgi:hypothetical protein
MYCGLHFQFRRAHYHLTLINIIITHEREIRRTRHTKNFVSEKKFQLLIGIHIITYPIF